MSQAMLTRSVEEMYALAAALLPELIQRSIVLLQGDLGSGKTTFVQGVGRALGVGRLITSPTFALVHEYRVEHPDIDTLVHADLYRLRNVDVATLADLGLDDAIKNPRTLLCIEWPERMTEDVSGVHLRFTIDGLSRLVEKM